jgi:glycosyltransferase involved in cell wall biosynthesis
VSLLLAVVLPTHNPDRGRLERTLRALRAQTLPAADWETVIVDNASRPAIEDALLGEVAPANTRIVREPRLGLTPARRAGLAATTAALLVFVDDDNVLDPTYLAHVVRLFAAHREVGALGGKSLPEFETTPPAWMQEFYPLLALRDAGDAPILSAAAVADPNTGHKYPIEAGPIGAGMALRREALRDWLASSAETLTDRCGTTLSSAGDNDIVLSITRVGWSVGYFPELRLTHLIPRSRLQPDYLGRLNRGIQQSWMEVLTKHGVNPWSSIPRWTLPLRKAKAWFTYRAWTDDAARIRWQGACGHFEGRRG